MQRSASALRAFRPTSLRGFVPWLAAGVLGAPGAAAEEVNAEERERRARHERPVFGNALLMRVAYVETLRSGNPAAEGTEEGSAESGGALGEEAEAEELKSRHVGLGVAYERVLAHGWLNLQVSGLAFLAPEGWELPAGVLLEVPWEWTEQIEAYVGAGLALDVLRESKLSPHLGVAASAGIFAWGGEQLGANVDVEYRWLPNEQLVYDVTIGVAAAVRY